jgi:glutamate racemase
MKIGLYDSGLGGLTILKAVREHMPAYDYVYLGDTANLPYGDKSESEIYALAHHAVERLFQEGVSLIIVACNTVSAEVLRRLQDDVFNHKYPDRRVLGVIIPTVEVLHESEAKHALLIGTKRTVISKKYAIELEKINSEIMLTQMATPSLVPKIEQHDFEGAFADVVPILDARVGSVDTLILGCTHYTMLKEAIRARYQNLHVISQDEIIPKKVEMYLTRHPEIESALTRKGTIEIILTENNERYELIKKMFFSI